MRNLILLTTILALSLNALAQKNNNQNLPISTQWTLDASGEIGRNSLPNIYLIGCPNTGSKGTGFQLKTGEFITCAHVVGNSPASEIIAISFNNSIVRFSKVIKDTIRDLAILVPTNNHKGGLTLGNEDSLKIGNIVNTWGFPYGHNGPSPLLSVGYLSGFKSYFGDPAKKDTIKHLVVNGAFNPGNSGGPLFSQNSDEVVGIVVSKMIPLLSDFEMSAIKALAENTSGVTFSRNSPDGKTEQIVESQVVAILLQTYQSLTQVMIGEAISINALKEFLKENGIKY